MFINLFLELSEGFFDSRDRQEIEFSVDPPRALPGDSQLYVRICLFCCPRFGFIKLPQNTTNPQKIIKHIYIFSDLFDIYKICTLLHRSTRKILAKYRY